MPKAKILLMEDDAILRYALKEYLSLQDYSVVTAKDGEEGIKLFKQSLFDLCIIDVMMPKKDGFTAANEIYAENAKVPFLFLSARSMKIDKLKAFKLGADDYIVKPVDEEELIARIEVVLRRHKATFQNKNKTYQVGKYQFTISNRRLSLDNHVDTLTEKEAKLLEMLCRSEGSLLQRDDALLNIWQNKDYFNRRSMDVHIARLRKYLRADPRIKITNIHGKGFILEIK
ncbi:MAG: response regulator transcription factor [Bacteroidota bacterium]